MDSEKLSFVSAKSPATELVSVSSFGVCDSALAMARRLFGFLCLTIPGLKAQHQQLRTRSQELEAISYSRAVVSAVLSGESSAVASPDALRTAHARASKKSVRQFLKDGFIETDAAFEILERKIFVWGMSTAIG